ncbi:PREDICTED: zinc finger protein 280C isoform X5 [Hipposideros armiger]|uniref:Zinc finger protein 280C isoform X5 n=1 Tax=Hipposideros armiger TaxID=186990 RepID=A0A8B7S807_HIPAR|nr:PREDICTED: zinc finger protein 280C isoform X5 [Hipposideros armiger]
MDDSKSDQPKNNSKMAELFMECEEEELEPWQKKVEEIPDEEDDELIFVREISSSKPAISNILNRGNSSSSSKTVKSETLSQGVTDVFKTTSQRYKDPTSNPLAALPRFHPEAKSSHRSVIVHNVSKPDFTKNSSQVESDDSSDLLFDLTQDTIPQSQEGSTICIEALDEALPVIKRPSASKVNRGNPKKPKTSGDDSEINSCASLSLENSSSVTSSPVMTTEGTDTPSTQHKTGMPFQRSCPKCNVQFNRLDALKYHMKKKGVHRCTKCRLQFLTCKEKMDHKTQHRTFIKPKELEGLPPGTKVTIRASLGSLHSKPSTTSSSNTPSTSLQVSPPESKNATPKNPTKSNASKPKTRKGRATTSTASKPNANKQGRDTSKCKAKTSCKQKKQRNRKNKISIALKNLRCRRGVHKCIECHSKIKDFASHFSIYIHCNFCKYNTNCNKAFINHMVSSHSDHPSKRFYIFKKHCGTLRDITLVCLKCDFLTDSSGLDRMAKHLSQRKTHTCQVIIENVPKRTSTSEPTSECRSNTEISKNFQGTPGQCPPSLDTPDACTLFPRNVNYLTVRPSLVCGLRKSVIGERPFLHDWSPIRLMLI